MDIIREKLEEIRMKCMLVSAHANAAFGHFEISQDKNDARDFVYLSNDVHKKLIELIEGLQKVNKKDNTKKTEVVQLTDLTHGDDVTFYFKEDGKTLSETGVVDIINLKKKTCILRTGPEALRIMDTYHRIERIVKPKPKKKKILEKYFFNIHQLNDWWNKNNIEIISINSHQSTTGEKNTVIYYYEK